MWRRGNGSIVRVLKVIETGGHGSGQHVLDLSRGLLARGHAVEIAASPRRMRSTFREQLRALGVPLHELPMRREPHLTDLGAIVRIGALLRRRGPFDLVHGHSSKGGAVARLARVLAAHRVRAVYTPHALITLDPLLSPAQRRFYGAAERILARFGQAIVLASREELQNARALGIPEAQLHFVLHGLGPIMLGDRADARRQLGLAPSDFCIGFLGRLSRQKAPERLLQAFVRVAAAASRVRLVVIGDGELAPRLREAATELDAGDRVLWAGERPGRDLIRAFDVFALSSRYETTAYAVTEALFAGLPIVTTEVPGCHEQVVTGENGFIVPQGSDDEVAERLAGHLLRLAADPELRQRLGAASSRRSALFTVDRMVEETLAVYRRVLAER
jgi:glycosyltransferase involved in cell wall biosynthesis